MKVSEAGKALIKSFESCRLEAYPDPGTGGAPYTIGYGSTAGVKKGDKITQARADMLLKLDVEAAARAVTNAVKVPLNQNQFDALVSFTFNVGAGALGESSLLRKLNDENYSGAANEFSRWIHAGGKILLGLVNRREAERKLFTSRK
ncbi:lysozyme [Kosakonia sacchari]|uniref:lysozyme n=1 Tax=Kosakonia sacchari TaxID=1158459 RepID=UPI001584BC94|nr:lysozyme [Kosakonia sacchari]NUL36619.1 lysozyme [Kosakonia sacchari]